ncbi:Mitochondrial glycoprotein [Actinidia chinensis var. chinensis]|uniref:Mitochondrial glycoprotein n=1 Tax=Actinidia chinensis var. chinensis TaxID=1590841 RepID=A0A2R6PD81_ACTCC|nr:Mitochondrial glycoprotein [Actinidia chinensis var. chinensis]
MARRLLRPLSRTLLSPLSSFTKKLIPHQQPYLSFETRTYVSEMRKSAFEGNLLRLLRNEIHYELEHSPPSQPVPEFNSFTVDERQGEQWIRLSRKFGENEEIKVEVTMFDGSLPIKKPCKIGTEEEVTLHITLIVDIYKGEGNEVLEFVCSAWPDSIEIRKIFMRSHDQMAGQPYMGPGFKGLDDELQESLYEFLEARGIDDDLAAFLHEYMKNKDKTEFIRWMGTVKTFIEKK